MTGKRVFHSCNGVNDIIFDLNGDEHAGLGWVVFEVDDKDLTRVTGAIALNNNVFTLKFLRHLNAQQPLRIAGHFTNSTEGNADKYVLDNFTSTGTLFNDEIGFVLFQATASRVRSV